MSNKCNQDSDSTNSDSRSAGAVARGDLLLSLLSQKAAAARAEAQCAELKLLLCEARLGNPKRLQVWLREHDREFGSVDVSSNDPAVDDEQLSSWEPLLPHARRRLQQRAGLLSRSRGERIDSTAIAEPEPDPLDDPIDERQPIAEFSKVLEPEELGKQKEKRHKHILFTRVGGLSASLVAHVLLIVLLAIITLKMPSPPASLAFESSATEVSTEVLELSESLEADAPEEKSLEPITPADSFDPSQDLADATSSANNALADGTLADMSAAVSHSMPGAALVAFASGSPNPMNANATFFGAAAEGNCFCFVIDGSGSMRGGAWEAAKLELLKSLVSLKEKQRFYIIFFNRELAAIPLPGERDPAPIALYANKENLEHARRWIDTLRIDIGAPPIKALEMAIEKEPDAIYLLTDGVTTADVAQFLRKSNRVSDIISGEEIRVPIHTIAFYSLEGQHMLQQIAIENRGQFIYVPDPRKR